MFAIMIISALSLFMLTLDSLFFPAISAKIKLKYHAHVRIIVNFVNYSSRIIEIAFMNAFTSL